MLWPETITRDATGRMVIGGIALTELAGQFGTPLYIFDEQSLRARAHRFVSAMTAAYANSRVLYAGKAYLSPTIVRILHEEGLGLDVVSGGELYGGLLAGVPVSDITFHGNNKSEAELREAVDVGVGYIAVDNDLELDRLIEISGAFERPEIRKSDRIETSNQVGSQLGTRVPLLLRLNPGIDVHTHDKIKTGAVDSKFGFPLWTGDAEAACAKAAATPTLDLAGFHVHLGSQLFDPAASRLAVRRLVEFAAAMRERYGVETRVISPGGGFGIAYTEQDEETTFAEWANVAAGELRAACDEHGLPLPELTVEPGRSIVGPAAVALYEVGASKRIDGVRHYVSVDGGMADNIRPSLYGAVYTAEIANRAASGPAEPVTIAGRYCESGDILIQEARLPELRPGDLLAMPSAGAYALPMASNYNAVPRPAVVLVNDGTARLIRRRETYADVFASEIVATVPAEDG
jgi:diaminopimelate decarboxylase